MGGIGGELDLAAMDELERSRGTKADDQRSDECGYEQEDPQDELGGEKSTLYPVELGQALACDQPSGTRLDRLEPERGSLHIDGRRPYVPGPMG